MSLRSNDCSEHEWLVNARASLPRLEILVSLATCSRRFQHRVHHHNLHPLLQSPNILIPYALAHLLQPALPLPSANNPLSTTTSTTTSALSPIQRFGARESTMFCLRSWIPILFFLLVISEFQAVYRVLTVKTKDKCITRLPHPLHIRNLLPQPAMRLLLAPPIYPRRCALRLPYTLV